MAAGVDHRWVVGVVRVTRVAGDEVWFAQCRQGFAAGHDDVVGEGLEKAAVRVDVAQELDAIVRRVGLGGRRPGLVAVQQQAGVEPRVERHDGDRVAASAGFDRQ